MRSSNPALSDNTFRQFNNYGSGNVQDRATVMTMEGTVQKAFLLLALCLIGAGITWSQLLGENPNLGLEGPLMIGGLVIATIAAFVAIFKPSASPIAAPIYAFCEGLALGAISASFNLRYPGIVTSAVSLTFGVLGSLLFAYQAGLIRATEPFKRGVIAATGAIAIVYLINIALSFFGIHMPYLHEASPIGIGISLVIVVVAALNFVLDFDFIERGVGSGAPKYMEWYGAFSLMLTLVWLYLEILRLLSLLRSRN